MTDTWNPAQYDRFQREREQPFVDLLAMVRPAAGMRVADLGCGTGKPTRVLHERLGARETIGIDRSPRMLEALANDPLPAGLRFAVGSIEAFPESDGAFDLIFSNAAFHWVADHPALLQRLAGALSAPGQLAFQVPAQHGDVPHLVADELTAAAPFSEVFNGWRRPQPVLTPEEYSTLLYRLGFRDPKVSLIVYPHVLAGPEEVVEWVKGTLLTEYTARLPAALADRFVECYRATLLERLARTRPFYFPFKRILCWGARA